MSYENKMMQLKQMLGKKQEKKVEKPSFTKPDKPWYVDEWKKEGLEVIENDFGMLFKRQVEYPQDYLHGSYQLKMFFEAIEKWQTSAIEHPFSIDYDETVVFFDTETTGLKGVGTNIFLLGFLEVLENKFLLTQYVLADPSHEAAFLFESKLWQRSKTIVTYNGKSFDWPQLETRWTLNQQILPKLKNMRQIDLLHSTKRIWKNNLERMKLTQVEETKLGFKRNGDIPGFLAPIIYTDAVKSGNASSLMKVLTHNEWDLLSLITLYIHSTNLLLESHSQDTATTYTNIGKWYGDLKITEQSETVLRTVTNTFHEQDVGLAHFYLAVQQKKRKEYDEATKSFQKALMTIGNKEKLKALEHLAIIYEHQYKDYSKAFDYTLKGIEMIQNNDSKARKLLDWTKRLNRLKNKMEREINN